MGIGSMKEIIKVVGVVTLTAFMTLNSTGCANKTLKNGGEYPEGGAAFAGQDPWGRSESELMATRTYFFGFDRYDLSDKDRYAVEAHARHLRQTPHQKVIVEGHTDERGSREYNIALAERRAKAVWDVMQAQGVNREQVRIVSYGKERPRNGGHDEAAWAENRRAEMAYE